MAHMTVRDLINRLEEFEGDIYVIDTGNCFIDDVKPMTLGVTRYLKLLENECYDNDDEFFD